MATDTDTNGLLVFALFAAAAVVTMINLRMNLCSSSEKIEEGEVPRHDSVDWLATLRIEGPGPREEGRARRTL